MTPTPRPLAPTTTAETSPAGRRRRVRTVCTGLVAAALAAVTLSSCAAADFASIADTPLGISADQRGVQIGDPVVGEIRNPDGTMTITLAPAPKHPRFSVPDTNQDPTAADVVHCDYDAGVHRYSCPTTGLTEGLYLVQVTDAAQPGEGTQQVPVGVTAVPGYGPWAGPLPDLATETPGTDSNGIEYSLHGYAGAPTPVPFTGLRPGLTLHVEVRTDGGKKVFADSARIGADGQPLVTVSELPAGRTYWLSYTDGLWAETLPLSIASVPGAR